MGFLWHYFAVLPEYGDRQRQIAAPMVSEVTANLSESVMAGEPKNDPFWVVNDLEEVMTTEEVNQILQVLKRHPELNGLRTPREVYLGYTRFRYLPDAFAAEMVIQWCKKHPLRKSQFGTYPNYSSYQYYVNYMWLWKIANQMWYSKDYEALEEAIVEDDGSCNQPLAVILSFIHRNAGTMPQWRESLDEYAKDPSLAGDAKATWLIARGYAEEVGLRGEPVPLKAYPWLELAAEAAESEPLKRHILRESCTRLAASDRCDDAQALIDAAEAAHDSPEARAEVAKWRGDIDALSQRYADARSDKRDTSGQEYVAELQRRLDRAQQRGDSVKADYITRKLQKAQK